MSKQPSNITTLAAQDSFSRAVERRLARMRVLARISTGLGVLILLVLAVVALGSSVVPRLVGLQPYAIVSGSMEPTYATGSLVFAEPAEGEKLQAGDIAAFWQGEDVITHRVQENVADEGELITKGDANAEPDVRPVPYQNVLGRVVFSMPVAGYFLIALGTTPGKLVLGWIVLMGAAFCIVGSVVGNLAAQQGRER